MDLPSLPIVLTGFEIIFLSDALRNGDTVKTEEDELTVLKPLILTIGQQYRDLFAGKEIKELLESGVLNNTIELHITKAQAWLLHSKVRSGDLDICGQNVGIELCTEIYNVLLNFEKTEVEPGLIDLETVDKDYNLTEEQKSDLREQKYARWRPDEDNYPSHSS